MRKGEGNGEEVKMTGNNWGDSPEKRDSKIRSDYIYGIRTENDPLSRLFSPK